MSLIAFIVILAIQGLIFGSGTGWRLCSAGIDPSSDPSAAYTKEFCPIVTGWREVSER